MPQGTNCFHDTLYPTALYTFTHIYTLECIWLKPNIRELHQSVNPAMTYANIWSTRRLADEIYSLYISKVASTQLT